jgi:hypothetical protein
MGVWRYLPESLVQGPARHCVQPQAAQVDEGEGQSKQCRDLAPLVLGEPVQSQPSPQQLPDVGVLHRLPR